jgi:hypothetical protein
MSAAEQTIAGALTFRPGDCTALAEVKTVRDLITVRYDLVIEALTPICHSSGNMGNESLFMTAKVADPDNPSALPEDVPCITGNSMRHALRESLAWLTLRLLNMEIGGLSVAAQHFLFSGGSLGKQAASLDVDGYRHLTELFPYVSIFGGGLGTSLLTGKLHCSDAMLLCRQNARRLARLCPALAPRLEGRPGAEEYRDREQRTRHDARRQPIAQHLMPEADRQAWARERNSSAKDHSDEGSDSTQMIYGREVLCAGAQLYWSVGGHFLTPLEHSALVCSLVALQHRRRIGAASGTGHGEVALSVIGAGGEVGPLHEMLASPDEGEAVQARAARAWGAPYVTHCQTHGPEITAWLAGLK